MSKNNADQLYQDLIPALSQLSDTSKQLLKGIQNENLSKLQVALENTKSSTDALHSTMLNNESLLSIKNTFKDNLLHQYIVSDIFPDHSYQWKQMFANMQVSVPMISNFSNFSPMIKDLAGYFSDMNYSGIVKTLQQSVDKTQINISDFSYIRACHIMDLKEIKESLNLPRGFATDIKCFNKSAALTLLNNNNISYNFQSREFINLDNTSSSATVPEMNSICSAKTILNKNDSTEIFTENELLDFMNFLRSTPTLALNNKVGKKILTFIQNYQNIINFDSSEFYRSRIRKIEELPFEWEQMKEPPYGISPSGRYNHLGQAYFYFCDTKDGTIAELSKHLSEESKNNSVIQTVKFKPSSSCNAKLIDLSAKQMRRYNTFLNFIQWPLTEDQGNMPKAYLIPSFISDCCKICDIDGIKYYGGKNYSNYVTWSDGFYEFVANV